MVKKIAMETVFPSRRQVVCREMKAAVANRHSRTDIGQTECLRVHAPTVSVVIVGYNGLSHVDSCLGSVLDQGFPFEHYQVILLDNASKDGMPEHVEKNYPEVRVIRLGQNYGFNEACNKSLAFVQGKFIVFLPQDTIVHHNWLSSLVFLAESDPDIKVCWTNTINPWAPEFREMDRSRIPKFIYFPEIIIFGFTKVRTLPYCSNPISSLGIAGTSFLIKRDIISELGAILDGSFSHYCGDTDLGLRTNLLGYKVVMSPHAVVYHLDTDKTLISVSLLKRYFLGTVDRVLLFFKCMSLAEFVLFCPLLMMGIPAKVFSINMTALTQLALFCAVLPLSPLIFVFSLFFVRKVMKGRKIIMRNRKREGFWLLKSLLNQGFLAKSGGPRNDKSF